MTSIDYLPGKLFEISISDKRRQKYCLWSDIHQSPINSTSVLQFKNSILSYQGF